MLASQQLAHTLLCRTPPTQARRTYTYQIVLKKLAVFQPRSNVVGLVASRQMALVLHGSLDSSRWATCASLLDSHSSRSATKREETKKVHTRARQQECDGYWFICECFHDLYINSSKNLVLPFYKHIIRMQVGHSRFCQLYNCRCAAVYNEGR